MPAAKQTEKRGFRIDKNAIMTLIGAQAGSLQKALLEGVANSQDAGATRVDIKMSPLKVSIKDNGKGFSSRDEINQFFDNFGFDHAALRREVGRFGVGRGQLFSFGRNRWTTNQFTMDVDIEQHGLDYELTTSKAAKVGMTIEIELYKPLDSSDVLHLDREFRKLVRFCPIPVFVNGHQVSKDPASAKWSKETSEAFIKLDDGNSIAVYSQGLFVQNLPNYEFGRGGVIVTKLGYPLQQNLARNDILRDKCPVWKTVRKSVQSLNLAGRSAAVTGHVKVTEGMRASLAMEAMGTPSNSAIEAISSASLATLTNGKHIRLNKLLFYPEFTSGPDNSAAADRLIQLNQAGVVNAVTLARFGVEDAPALLEAVRAQVKRLDEWQRSARDYSTAPGMWRLAHALESARAVMSMSDLSMVPSEGFTVVKESEWTTSEKLVFRALRQTVSSSLSTRVHKHLMDAGKQLSDRPVLRSLELMVSDTALACTDGATHIWINRPYLNSCIKAGPAGFIALCQTLVHELLHDIDSSTGHVHDHEFYEAFHDICLDPLITEWGLKGYRSYLAHGGKAAPADIALMENTGQMSTEDAVSRHDALTAVSEVEVAVKSSRKKASMR
jgi:hypothetical protein